MARGYTRRQGDYNQNDGVPGVVYILRNEAFKEHWLKIGCTRHSGHKRAADMNREASTGLPAHHVCVFEIKTLDCGRAEKRVHQSLSRYRKGRQEFFEVDIEIAKSTIIKCCAEIDELLHSSNKKLEEVIKKEVEDKKIKENIHQKTLNNSSKNYIAQVDVFCPECGTELVAKIISIDYSSQKFRCPSCKEVSTLSSGLTPRNQQAIQPEALYGEKRYLPAKKGYTPGKTDYIIGLMVIFLLIGVAIDKNSKKQEPPVAVTTMTEATPKAVVQPTPQSTQPQAPAHAATAQLESPPRPRITASSAEITRKQQQRQDELLAREVAAALARAYQEFPFLQSPDGVEAMHHIKARAAFLMEERHVSTADAYDQAVRGIAPRFEPLWYKDIPLNDARTAP